MTGSGGVPGQPGLEKMCKTTLGQQLNPSRGLGVGGGGEEGGEEEQEDNDWDLRRSPAEFSRCLAKKPKVSGLSNWKEGGGNDPGELKRGRNAAMQGDKVAQSPPNRGSSSE